MALAVSQDETALLIKGAKTDPTVGSPSEAERRPQVSNLLLLAALCLEADPTELAEQGRGAGAAAPEPLAADALNDRLPHGFANTGVNSRRRWQRSSI